MLHLTTRVAAVTCALCSLAAGVRANDASLSAGDCCRWDMCFANGNGCDVGQFLRSVAYSEVAEFAQVKT
jgi:hypothetical protein